MKVAAELRNGGLAGIDSGPLGLPEPPLLGDLGLPDPGAEPEPLAPPPVPAARPPATWAVTRMSVAAHAPDEADARTATVVTLADPTREMAMNPGARPAPHK